MATLPLTDMHTHVFSSLQEEEAFHRFLRRTDLKGHSLLPPLLTYMQRAGVTRVNMLLFPVSSMLFHEAIKELPPTPEGRQQAEAARKGIVERIVAYNEWGVTVSKENPQISVFMGLDPTLMDERAMLSEMEDKLRKGAKGVKLVPIDYCAFLNDRRLWPVYDFCQAHNIPMVTYAGGAYCLYSARLEQWGHPQHGADVFRAFPRLRMNYAHMAAGAEEAFVEVARSHRPLMGDLSVQLAAVGRGQTTPESLVALIRHIGAERVMFGTNFGTVLPEVAQQEVDVFHRLPLTNQERELIATKNFEGFIAR